MDEPLSSLDAKLRVEMRTELKRLHAQLSATFVYVTHDQAEAMTMADRIVVMHQGRIQQTGPPLQIYNEPANRFVAGFFGVPAMNFIDGEIRPGADGFVCQAPALRMALTRPAPGGPATLGVRPEHVRLGDGPDGWPATVSLIEPLGDETLVFLDYGGPASLVAKVAAEDKVAVGERRHVTFRGDKLVFFDGAAGSRLL
jgi:multiple sugar transport system ATP-binding protein